METPKIFYRIRKIQSGKDLLAIGNLIESCFHRYLDPDGRQFVDQLREAGKAAERNCFYGLFNSLEYQLQGFVSLNEKDEIIGVVCLFPGKMPDGFGYLIANVGIADAYRRNGIATALMKNALAYAKSHSAGKVYLQVREETAEAVAMYEKLGFKIDAKRTTWIRPQSKPKISDTGTIRLIEPKKGHRLEFETLFNHYYPQPVRWNLNYYPVVFQIGVIAKINKLLSNMDARLFQVADDQSALLAWVAWQHTENFTDILWLIPTDDCSEEQMTAILKLAGDHFCGGKAIQINVEKGFREQVFRNAGFFKHGNLIWMSKDAGSPEN